MSKVISKILSLKLRRGLEKLPDPYSYNGNLRAKIEKGFKRTLGFFNFRSWRSGTFIRNQKNTRIIGAAASFALLTLAVLTVRPIVLKRNNAEGATAYNAATTTLEVTASHETAAVEVTAGSATGTFATSSDSNMGIFTVTTNNYTGYTLNIAGADNNGRLVNADDDTVYIDSIAAEATADDFEKGAAGTYNNKWGYQANLLNTSTSEYEPLLSGKYQPAPTTTSTTINTTESANASGAVDTYGLRLGARVDYTNVSGTYANTFTLTAVANPAVYTITYNDSTSDSSVADLPSQQHAEDVSATSITLDNATPTRTGYTFAGWCDGVPTHTASGNSTCPTGKDKYAAGATYYIDQTTANASELYALWNVKTYSLTVNFAGKGVSSVAVRTAAGESGGSLIGTVSTSGNAVSGLAYEKTYYLYPTFDSAKLESWAKDATDTYGTLICAGNDCETDENPTYTVGAGNGSVTLTGKSSGGGGLYATIAAMSKGKQTADDLKTAIVAPTSSATISSNSGVYEYDPTVFGAATDADNQYPIYYYRGILDTYSGMGSNGAAGKADAYPNYVRLGGAESGSTCWRIVRTTGSGGVKMIYTGTWTNGSCANTGSAAQLSSTSAFNTAGNGSNKSIVKVGYTFNNSYTTTTSATQAGVLFGTNSSYSGNSTDSTIKTAIDTWYNSTLASKYGSHLEPSAGYCADRQLNTGTNWTTPMSDTSTVSTPYTTASSGITRYNFGAYVRVYNATQKPTLTCARNNADLYTTSAASNGNKQLSNPIALLTADEVSFAGSGNNNSSVYHVNSFLNSGSFFWLLSPYIRSTNGSAVVFGLNSSGYLGSNIVSDGYGVRSAISISQGANISSGTGIATDPWEISW